MKKTYLQPEVVEMMEELEEELMLVTSTTDADPSLESLSRENDLWDEE